MASTEAAMLRTLHGTRGARASPICLLPHANCSESQALRHRRTQQHRSPQFPPPPTPSALSSRCLSNHSIPCSLPPPQLRHRTFPSATGAAALLGTPSPRPSPHPPTRALCHPPQPSLPRTTPLLHPPFSPLPMTTSIRPTLLHPLSPCCGGLPTRVSLPSPCASQDSWQISGNPNPDPNPKSEPGLVDGAWRGARAAYALGLGETARELDECLDLVDSVGHGFVYLGSSRVPPPHPFFLQSQELSRQVALRFGSTTWSGIGPGLMEAVCQGAAQAGMRAAGFKVVMEATQGPTASYKHPHLAHDSYLVCRSLVARKQGLVWAGSRSREDDRAGFVALPGGVGTLDELLDLLAVRQLSLDRSKFPVPFLVMNYGGCYDGLLACFKDMERFGLVREGELDPLWSVCASNEEALAALERFYGA